MADDNKEYEGWSILELLGHRRLGGYVKVVEMGGAPFFRIDVPGEHGGLVATMYYSPGSLYCLTPTTEAMARAVAAHNQPAPVQRWELPRPKPEEAAEDDTVDVVEPEWREDDDR